MTKKDIIRFLNVFNKNNNLIIRLFLFCTGSGSTKSDDDDEGDEDEEEEECIVDDDLSASYTEESNHSLLSGWINTIYSLECCLRVFCIPLLRGSFETAATSPCVPVARDRDCWHTVHEMVTRACIAVTLRCVITKNRC